ncbi:hypothetical protein Thiowin_01496 [Thiorhodovibrio winogradskyi]|uniref:Uncharacterized protein n=1 Tax=Thiorhodovibrio winogradskyi TaxID=77007 RepID=A0ABZ0S686_9GAMM|nr:hypothetical protein [Thiorhodovibrio winogradskyi]
MKIFLDNTLADHRRGRFFATHLDAIPVGEQPPQAGVVMMTGSRYQGLDAESKAGWRTWFSRSGRTLLLVPPFEPRRLCDTLDWELVYRNEAPAPSGISVPDRLREEVSFEITGQAGEADKAEGHRWPDGSVNTRYAKQHSGTGVFAVTCLPLWSISLLDKAADLDGWLRALHEHAGKTAADDNAGVVDSKQAALSRMDYGLLVALYAWQTSDPDVLIRANETSPVPLFWFDEDTLVKGVSTLREMGFLGDSGLTERGVVALQRSPFWGYAIGLREEVA